MELLPFNQIKALKNYKRSRKLNNQKNCWEVTYQQNKGGSKYKT